MTVRLQLKPDKFTHHNKERGILVELNVYSVLGMNIRQGIESVYRLNEVNCINLTCGTTGMVVNSQVDQNCNLWFHVTWQKSQHCFLQVHVVRQSKTFCFLLI